MPAKDMAEILRAYLIGMVILLPVGAACLFWLRCYIKRNCQPAPPLVLQAWWKQAGWGAAMGCGALAVAVIPGWLAGSFNPASPGWVAFANTKLPAMQTSRIWWFFTVQALSEELAFRVVGLGLLGILLMWLAHFLYKLGGRQAEPSGKTPQQAQLIIWCASGVVSTLVISLSFASAHLNNPHVTVFSIVNIGLAGVALGLMYWVQANVLGAWIFHLIWNAGLATLGLPVSGMSLARPDGLSCFSGAVPGLLTGGSFGPEGSAMSTVGLGLTVAVLVIIGLKPGQKQDRIPSNINDVHE